MTSALSGGPLMVAMWAAPRGTSVCKKVLVPAGLHETESRQPARALLMATRDCLLHCVHLWVVEGMRLPQPWRLLIC